MLNLSKERGGHNASDTGGSIQQERPHGHRRLDVHRAGGAGCELELAPLDGETLAQTPELVKRVHLDYFKAGADRGITRGYQATIPGLMENGYTKEEARTLIARGVSIFLETRDEWWEAEGKDAGRAYPLCLAGIGPYGAYLADGSEHRGKYGISKEKLRAFHQERLGQRYREHYKKSMDEFARDVPS